MAGIHIGLYFLSLEQAPCVPGNWKGGLKKVLEAPTKTLPISSLRVVTFSRDPLTVRLWTNMRPTTYDVRTEWHLPHRRVAKVTYVR